MRRARSFVIKGEWDGAATATATLNFDERYRRRVMLRDSIGEFLLDLQDARVLQDGDGLKLDDGGIILVRAADESVADISATTQADIARIAWHIGNRHTPLQVLPNGQLRFRDDGVLSKMVEGLGGTVTFKRAPFSPESGAYAQKSGGHSHDNGHSHNHHGHSHEH